ncbi:tetratricopeptide repeat protein [Streptomyces sp. NPDC051211]|uniref:tetratricopeptide repeat protein n=1 Tax=Streptomyces sp. NPDC051211 TaxID=3154643 RepID=UPI00344D6251
MTGSAGGGQDIHNEISGGLFHNVVVQGGTVTLQLPPTLHPALTGMPAPSLTFTGRDADAGTLLAGLRPPPGATGRQVVAGLPGVGKTELVLQVADRALKTPGLLPGGVLFIDLFGYDDQRRLEPHRALGSLLRALAVPDEYVPEDLEDRARLYRSVLDVYAADGRRVLLVLDNAMNSAQIRPLLPGDPRSPVLITSRHTLSDLGARVHDLSVLDEPSAVELLGRNLHMTVGPEDTRVADEPASAEEISALCGRLPLALRIVSALLADLPARPLHSMAGALRDARGRLARLSRDDLAVRAAFELSFRQLRPDQARLFRLLPLNPGPDLSTEAAAHLAGLPPETAEELLLPLARGHFVEPGASYGRWRMHDLMRLYAAELCRMQDEPDEQEAALDRLFGHYLDAARTASTHMNPLTHPDPRFADREHALAWLDEERHNLLAAALAAPAMGRPRALVELHYLLHDFHSWRHHFDDAAELALNALRAVRSPGHPELHDFEAAVLNNLGTVQRELRRFDDSVASYLESLRLYERRGNAPSAAITLSNLGLTYWHMNRPEEAVEALLRALALYPPDTDRRVLGMAFTNLGKALHSLRRLEEAADAFGEDIAVCRETHDRIGEGVALNNLGMVLRDMGRYAEAVDAHEQALAAARETKDRRSEGLAQSNLGLALALARDDRGPAEAIDLLSRSIELLDSLSDEHMATHARHQLGLVLIHAGRSEEALSVLSAVVGTSRAADDPDTEAMALSNLGLAQEMSGRFDDAVRAQTRAVALYRRLGNRHLEGRALLNLGLAFNRTHAWDAAIEAYGDSAAAFRETGDEELFSEAMRCRDETERTRLRRQRRRLRSPGTRRRPE